MSRLTRTIRALILALVLPALLVPSGWSAHLCLCSVAATEATQSCCEPDEAQLESDGACCSNESADLDSSAPIAGDASDCGRGGCKGCCRIVEADGFELVFASSTQLELPAMSVEVSPFAAPLSPPASNRVLRACSRSLAPPRASTPLPLRI